MKMDQGKVQILDQRQEKEIVLKELMVDLNVQERAKYIPAILQVKGRRQKYCMNSNKLYAYKRERA